MQGKDVEPSRSRSAATRRTRCGSRGRGVGVEKDARVLEAEGWRFAASSGDFTVSV
ncbi:MAG: hypothetical protein AVDCRST_MAG02-1436 [uncultured Rubrobacteraceae bacterium]|uniref:Uncharacterized protein n=1 Tax=uncultured Rubrobacteraceae bacterium TaxID=349277 RepID=A0A6J4R1X6_9ACTN|nr:MAG: hypothetical protein AVDCRST_MAG02-1436 [uncultured Rubrobacteraceae bacterium]